jgi:adenylosuccinate synthase
LKLIVESDLLAEIESIRQKILPFMVPSFEISVRLKSCKAVMFEGAQGSLLDVSYGTYPFVTSSNIAAGQIALGSCLGIKEVHRVIGVLKAYTTRVGSGPFPTELCDETGEFLRKKGNEYGTVTGRNRRCGWFDAALVRQAIDLSSVAEIALTKLDVLDELPVVKICTGYEIDGKLYNYLPSAVNLWSKIKPVFLEMPGWMVSTAGATSIQQLPENAIRYLKKIEEICAVKISIISTGAKREETILVK